MKFNLQWKWTQVVWERPDNNLKFSASDQLDRDCRTVQLKQNLLLLFQQIIHDNRSTPPHYKRHLPNHSKADILPT